MAKFTKPIIIAGFAVAVFSVSGFGAYSVVNAEDASGQSLSDKLATTFNLDKSKVQETLDEYHDERQADRQAKYEEYLGQKVSDGTITEEQKQLIIKKQAELRTEREQNRDTAKELSSDERKKLRDEKRTEMQTWLEENDIPAELLRPAGKGHHGGEGRRGDIFTVPDQQ